MAIAVPQWQKSRDRTRRITCLENLKQIEDAKDITAISHKMNVGDPVTEAEIIPEFIRGTTMPVCPGGGEYTINSVGTPVECSVHGAWSNLSGE